MIRVLSPATTANLGPGFDCLGMALELTNEVCLETHEDGGLRIEIEGEGSGLLPRNETNLAFRAAQMIFRLRGGGPKNLGIKLVNRIPLARGLGSSAATIVGAMLAARELLDLGIDDARLLAMAAELEGHPDNVAPALYGGITAVCQEGTRFAAISFTPPRNLEVVIAVPDFELKTSEARRVLPAQVPRADAVFNVGHAAFLAVSLAVGKMDDLGFAMDDRLHQPYREGLVPGFPEVVRSARSAGALGAALSGAGPTVMALIDRERMPPEGAEEVGRAMVQAFAHAGVGSQAFVLRPSLQGARVVP